MKNLYILIIVLFAMTLDSYAVGYEDSLVNVLENTANFAEQKETLFLLGEYLVQRNPEQAEIYADRINKMIGTIENQEEWGRLNYIYAASHRWQGNYRTALDYYQQNYDFYKANQDSINIAKTGKFIGNINTFLGNNTIAQRHLLECAEIYARIGTPKEVARINSSLAGFYLNIDQWDKGLERYLVALEQFEEINDSAGMAGINCNLGLVYTELGEFERAEMHLMRQRELNAVFPTLREMGFHYDFLGLLRREQGRLEEAYEEHTKALEIRKELSSTYNLCESRLHTGQILIDLERYNESIFHLKDVLSYEEHESLNQQSSAHRLLSEAYEKKGSYAEALNHYKTYAAISDSIYNEENSQIIAEKDAQYQKKEQDAEIAMLNQEKLMAEAQLRRSRAIIIGSIAALLLLATLALIFYRFYTRIKAQNTLIGKTLREKDMLMNEIHHRVKNNLQVVSSLLNLQSRYIKDEAALEAIKDGKNRVESMAILHRNLYEDDDINGVNMRRYFSNLIRNIFDSYNLTEDEIELQLDIEDLKLDIDTVIPLGLISNELITNSLKYAFKENPDHAAIRVNLKEIPDNYELTISDNGIGIDDEVIQSSESKSFGQRMIKAFVTKLKARMEITNTDGTMVRIQIPKGI